MNEFFRRHREHWTQSESRSATIFSVLVFIASMVVSYYAEIFATNRASNPVDDLILNRIPAFDLEWIYLYGAVGFLAFCAVLIIMNPKTIPFTLHSLTLFFFIRAFFITLTHLGHPLPVAVDLATLTSRVVFGGGLFFSGHVGAPFLMALVFWKQKTLRYIFLAASILLGIIALLGHYHYTIDVVSAFFITYTIFHISKTIFKRDYELFNEDRDLLRKDI